MNMEFKKPNGYNRRPPQRGGSRPAASHPAGQYSPPTVVSAPIPPVATKTDTAINFRSFSSITSYPTHFFTKKVIVISVIVLAIVGLLAIGLVIHQRDVAKQASNNKLSESVEDLEYQTILPGGKSIKELGGWTRVSPAKSEPVYAYTDTLDGISINVSEQPLPKSFIGDTDGQVEELAKKFNATSKITAGDLTVYVGTSSKGPQSVIFTKNSLLVLIKSQKKIDDTAWARYIKSLN